MLPKWARCRLAVNKLLNNLLGVRDKLTREDEDKLEYALLQAWRKGYAAAKRKEKP